jgi:hypothetical protein
MSPSETLSPSTDFLGAPVIRLPCSADFATGRGGFLQLLSASLPSCCRFHPARVKSPLQSGATIHAAFALQLQARPPGPLTFEATSAFTFVTAQWLAVIPRMIWSIGFKDSVSFLLAIQATRLLTFASVGLSPTEHASLRWTHNCTCGFPACSFHEDSFFRDAIEGINCTRFTSPYSPYSWVSGNCNQPPRRQRLNRCDQMRRTIQPSSRWKSVRTWDRL